MTPQSSVSQQLTISFPSMPSPPAFVPPPVDRVSTPALRYEDDHCTPNERQSPGEFRRVEPRPQPPTHDPDLDPPWPAAGANGRPPLYFEEFQRLVANPFLAIFWLIVLFGILREALAIKSLPLVGLATGGLLALGHLLQYHCRDCGSTGLLFRWKSHACPSVLARQQTGRARRIRGPNPYTQLILWIYVLIGTGILVAVVLRHVGP